MESFWNSLDTVNAIRIFSQWVAAIFGIIALIFTLRGNTLKSISDEIKDKEYDKKVEKVNVIIKNKDLEDRIRKYDRTAYDEAIKKYETNPDSEEGKYMVQMLKEKGEEFEKFFRENSEGKVYYSNFNQAYYKGIEPNDKKAKTHACFHQIDTSNHLLEAAWGFIALKDLGFEIDIFDFIRLKAIKEELK